MNLNTARILTYLGVGLALAASAPAAEHADIIIKNAHVLTIDASANVYEAGVVAIRGDSIAAVGGTDLLGQYEADTVIDAGGDIVMPGMISVPTEPTTAATEARRNGPSTVAD